MFICFGVYFQTVYTYIYLYTIQKSKLKGHIFSHDKNYVHTTKSKGEHKSYKILVLDFEDNVIGTYNSMAECKKELNYKGNITNLIKIGGVSKKLKRKFKFV